MRTILGYDADRRPIWSENVPAENVGWGRAIGGRAIEAAPSETDRRLADAKKYNAKVRGLRGAKLK